MRSDGQLPATRRSRVERSEENSPSKLNLNDLNAEGLGTVVDATATPVDAADVEEDGASVTGVEERRAGVESVV